MQRKKLFPLLFAATLAGGCTTLKPPPPQPHVNAMSPAVSGVLAETAQSIRRTTDPGESNFLLLSSNRAALDWRLALADHATRSIDAQYYIWEDDETGNLLFDRLLRAADRGVRVRLLVDDLLLAAKDKHIAAISRHPNLEIRVFNPGRVRGSTLGAMGEFLLNFREMNRRMHNKLFVVDNLFGIVGGRNIGNPYFGLSEKYNFIDLGVLTAGPVIEEISSAFDEYWNSEKAYPGAAMARSINPELLPTIRQELSQSLEASREILASYPLQPRSWHNELRQLPATMASGEAHFLQDNAVLIDGSEVRLWDMLEFLAQPSHSEVFAVTPYLIPVDGFLSGLRNLSEEGVSVKLLTASMASNNHTSAHSHYKKYRRPILESGAQLKEFRHDPAIEMSALSDVSPVRSKFISLHTKALVGDRQRCFIGSLNLDPRALSINTENGLYIESPELARQMVAQFDLMMAPENAWQVSLHERGRLNWYSSAGTVSIQPARGVLQRIADFFLRLLPIESQL